MKALAHEARATAALALILASTDASSIANRPLAFVSVKSAPFNAKGDGITDDSAAIQSAINTLAGTGIAVWFPGGTYVVRTTINIPSQSTIWGSSSATLSGSISGAFPLAGSILRTGLVGIAVANTTVNATGVIGSQTLTVVSTAGFAPGMFAFVADANAVTGRRTIYKIEAVGPTTLTLDRPLSTSWIAGDTVAAWTSAQVPQGIRILGNGMHIQGAAVVSVSLQSSYECDVFDLNFGQGSATSPSDAFFGFNNACALCTAQNLKVDGSGGGAPSVGMAPESSDGCVFKDCVAENCTGNGLSFINSTNCVFRDCQAYGNAFGLVYTNDILSTRGSDWCIADGCTLSGNTHAGIAIGAGSLYASIIACNATGNGTFGLDTTSTTPPTDFIVDGSTFVGNTSGAVLIVSGAKRGRLSNITIDGKVTTNTDLMTFAEDCQCSDISILSAGGSGRPIFVNGGDVTFSNLSVTRTRVGAASLGISVAAGSLTIDGGKEILAVNGDVAFACTVTGKLIVQNFKVTVGVATGTVGFFSSGAGSVTRILENVDVSATATPLDFTGGIQNRFTQVLAGAATTVVAWPDLKSTDNIELQIQAVAGTLEAPYQITPNPGVGFTITPLGGVPALDTSTLQVYIS